MATVSFPPAVASALSTFGGVGGTMSVMAEAPQVREAKIFDGREAASRIAETLAGRVRELSRTPRLALIHFDDPAAPSASLREKFRVASRIGVELRVYPFAHTTSARQLSDSLNQIAHEAHTDGIVVQLPLPEALDRNRHGILRIIPEHKDVDCITERWFGRMMTGRMTLRLRRGEAILLPPVVAAIAHALTLENMSVSGKRVVIVGWGDLVGKPAAVWFLRQGATVTVATETEADLPSVLRDADIIVSGVGKPRIISGSIIPQGAVVFDAGTSEIGGGRIAGDVDVVSAAKRASFLTPVPGGLGPLTVTMLFRNLLAIAEAS